jgi:hypothetical protein
VPSGDACADADQISACVGVDEGDRCTVLGSPGLCKAGVCVRGCGDGFVDTSSGEECEGTDLRGLTCQTFGAPDYYEGSLGCSEECRFDTSTCSGFCGDGLRNGPELCDGTPPETFCTNLGFSRGLLSCSQDCARIAEDCMTLAVGGLVGSPAEVSAVSGRSAADFWIGTLAGEIYHFDGGRFSFESFVGGSVRRIAASSARVLAATNSMVFEKQPDGSWQSTGPTLTSITDLKAAPGGDVYLVGQNGAGTLWADRGSGWENLDSELYADLGAQPPPPQLRTTFAESDGSIWVGGGRFSLWGPSQSYLAHFDGTQWTTKFFDNGPPITHIARTGDDIVVGTTFGLWRLTGSAMENLEVTAGFVHAMESVHGKHVYAATANELLLFNGDKWTSVGPLNATNSQGQLWSPEPWRVYSAHGAAGLKRFDGTGVRDVEHPDFIAQGTNGAFAVGVSGNEIHQLADDGWETICAPPDCPLPATAVWPQGRDDILVIQTAPPGPTRTHTLWRWTPELGFVAIVSDVPTGNSAMLFVRSKASTAIAWSRADVVGDIGVLVIEGNQASFRLAPISDVWMASETLAFAVGNAGLVEKWESGEWTSLPSPPTDDDLLSIAGLAPDDLWVTSSGAAYHFDGTTWDSESTVARRAVFAGNTNEFLSLHVARGALLVDGSWQRIDLGVSNNSNLASLSAGISRPKIIINRRNQPTRIISRYKPWDGCALTETTCDDRIDEDCDGYIDQHDSDCN